MERFQKFLVREENALNVSWARHNLVSTARAMLPKGTVFELRMGLPIDGDVVHGHRYLGWFSDDEMQGEILTEPFKEWVWNAPLGIYTLERVRA